MRRDAQMHRVERSKTGKICGCFMIGKHVSIMVSYRQYGPTMSNTSGCFFSYKLTIVSITCEISPYHILQENTLV